MVLVGESEFEDVSEWETLKENYFHFHFLPFSLRYFTFLTLPGIVATAISHHIAFALTKSHRITRFCLNDGMEKNLWINLRKTAGDVMTMSKSGGEERKAIQFLQGNAFEGNLNIFYVAILCSSHRKKTKVFYLSFWDFRSSTEKFSCSSLPLIRDVILDVATTSRKLSLLVFISFQRDIRRHRRQLLHLWNLKEDCILIFTIVSPHETIILINRHISQTFTMKNIV